MDKKVNSPKIRYKLDCQTLLFAIVDFPKTIPTLCKETPNGLRYLRWGGDGEAVQPEKGQGVENCLRLPQNPQRQVHALLARVFWGSLP